MVAEEYCWAITQAAGRSCCCRTGSGVLGLGFRLVLFLSTSAYIYIYMPHSGLRKIRRAPNYQERNYCVIRGVSVDREERGTVFHRAESKSTVIVTRKLY